MPGGFDNPVHTNPARLYRQDGNDSARHHNSLYRSIILPAIQAGKTKTLKSSAKL